jgi:WD40 repeat protein/DNA-binding SARP family transcriptional activator/energy-coupling factor transporter ATP-binding protein EcfA2
VHYARAMRFQILGPLEVETDDRAVVLGRPKERLLLALLLTRPNQVATVEALIRGLWGEQPPPTAARTLQSHVKRLRRVLEPGRAPGAAGEVLVTREPGYLLRVAPGALDAARFEELTAQARRALGSGAVDAAASLLRQALGLWRGQAFEEFTGSDVLVAEAGRLGELRLAALEDRVEADLRLGRHRELVAELEQLIREQPLRERLWAQLLLVLYRSGRQADALLAYQRARSVLVEELGIDPGAELRRLQAAILAQDPGLDLPPTAAAAPSQELPEALQPVGPAFVGRAAELAWLGATWTRAVHGRGGVVFLAGGPGVGKTRLAAEFAREVHDQGGWVLYGRCEPATPDPLQPLAQALVGWGAAGGDLPRIQRSPAAFGEGPAELLAGRQEAAVLLVVDDLHLAQASTLEALVAVAAAAASRRLLVLGAYRDEVAPPPLAELVQRLDPDGTTRQRLGPFDQDEVAQVLGLYGSEQAAGAAAGAVLERTGGVPLRVHQAAGDWAQAHAAHQLEDRAGQIASRRSHLREDSARFAEDVADLRGLREHTQQVARLAGQGPPDEELEDRPAAAVCPYKGLARFESSDAAFFFGRERLVADLVTHLVGAGLVGVVGPSGSGKSSLVRAGLLPALREGVLPGSDRWRQLILRPGEHPMAELADAAGRDAAGDGNGSATTGDGGQARQAPPPGQRADERLRALAGAERLVLVVDQFEEVFTTCQDEGERSAFLAALTEAAWADSHVSVVVAIRADYYGHLAAAPDLADLLAANHVLVGPMRQDELRRAIELPAHRAGLRLEPGLSAAMVEEVADQPGGLPLLSCALLESWQRRHGRTMTLAAYHQAGGVRAAVARLAERAWQQLVPDQQAVARRILLRLAGPGEGEAVVRRRVPLSEFTADREQHVRVVVEALTDQRLLTTSQDSVEVAHEALLREWPRLRGWLEEDVQGRALHRHLIAAAREWDESGRDPGALYRGARLTGALDWTRDHDADLNTLEREYLDASRAAAEQEVADARRRAEQEARRARREARISRRLRAALAGLAFLLVFALVAGGFAFDLRGRAERQALVADSRRLSAQALLESDLGRSLLLAEQAVRLDDSVDTRSVLLTSLLRSPKAVRRFRAGDNQLSSLALSPDGRTLAAVDGLGLVYLWDALTGHRLAGPLGEPALSGFGPAFSPDGHLLATCGPIGTPSTGGLGLWDVARRTVVRQLPLPSQDDEVTDAAFSPDGRVLAAGTLAGDLIFWNPASGARLGPILHPHHPPNRQSGITLAFARRGATLVTSAQHDKTIVWNLARRRPVRTIPVGTAALALSPDGSTVALGQGDSSIILADTATGRRRRVVTGHGPGVPPEDMQLAFSPDGASVASLSDDRTVVVWNVATGQTKQTLRGHASPVTGVAFSPNGNTLYTGSLNDGVIAWDLTGTRGLVRQLTTAAGPVAGVAFSPRDPNLLALAQREGPVTLWNPTRRTRIGKPFAVTGGSENPIAFSADGKILAATDHADGAVVLFDLGTPAPAGRRLPSLHPLPSAHPPHNPPINDIAFTRNSRLLATGDENGLIVLWDLAKQAPIDRPRRPQHAAGITAVAFSPDGRTLASGVRDGTVFLTHVPDGTALHILTVANSPDFPTAIAFSPDGNTLATAGSDGRVRLWDPHTGAARGPAWTAQGGMVLSMSFSPDGSVLATSGDDGTAALWDIASGKQIGAPLTGPPGPTVAAFDPTGHTLATAFNDGTVLLWDVDPASWRARACAVAGRRLTPQEWREFLPDRPYQPSCEAR